MIGNIAHSEPDTDLVDAFEARRNQAQQRIVGTLEPAGGILPRPRDQNLPVAAGWPMRQRIVEPVDLDDAAARVEAVLHLIHGNRQAPIEWQLNLLRPEFDMFGE